MTQTDKFFFNSENFFKTNEDAYKNLYTNHYKDSFLFNNSDSNIITFVFNVAGPYLVIINSTDDDNKKRLFEEAKNHLEKMKISETVGDQFWNGVSGNHTLEDAYQLVKDQGFELKEEMDNYKIFKNQDDDVVDFTRVYIKENKIIIQLNDDESYSAIVQYTDENIAYEATVNLVRNLEILGLAYL